ncbi:MAG: YitT family protein [Lactobacillales bacterium]|jgi:uncharacterized membrane-anchored protein YitT (DUF2179 family)|nr:YitT family protein [Lactobacillales bacterium]
MFDAIKKIPFEKYSEKFSGAIVYAILSSFALNFFFQPGHVYSSGVTGLAQILTAVSKNLFGFTIPVSITLYIINIPLFVLAWYNIGKRFTIFTFITVTLSSIFIHIMPETTLTTDPIINAIFGGAVNGVGIGYALRNGLSSGGLDIVSLSIRKKTGNSVGSISMMFNGVIVLVAGYLFGWQYAMYSILTIFVSGKVTDAVFTKQKKMQVMIVTKLPDEVIACLQGELRRGVTIVHGAEGAYYHENQTILFTIVTRFEIASLKSIMKESDPNAFVSIADNVKILGNFYEEEL